MESEYCSSLSRQYNEQIFATAPHFTKLLLVEYNAAWVEKPLAHNHLPAEVNSFLRDYDNSSRLMKTLFIKRNQKEDHQINIFAVHNLPGSPYINHFTLTDYTQLLDFSEDDLFSATAEHRLSDVLYLVCTNGRRDRCCAKFGIPIVNELTQFSPHVWECTHVGGHRFAPNVVIAPYCLFYGTLNIEDVSTLVQRTSEQQVLLDAWRGRSCNAPVEQAAEYYLRKQEGNFNIFDCEVIQSNEIGSQLFEVEIRNTQTGVLKKLTIQQGTDSIKRRYSCNAVEEEYPKTFQLIN